MKKYVVALGLALLVAAPIVAQKDGKEPAKCGKTEPAKCGKTEPAKCGAKEPAKDDYVKIYKTKGNNWTMKSTSSYGGEETIQYHKYEVSEVTDTAATMKLTYLDKDKKPIEGMEAATWEVNFADMTSEPPEDINKDMPEAPKPTKETIKVGDVEFECEKQVWEGEGYKSTSWMSTKWHILVKSESLSGEKLADKSTYELVEFNCK